jgi:hypothetical protein
MMSNIELAAKDLYDFIERNAGATDEYPLDLRIRGEGPGEEEPERVAGELATKLSNLRRALYD